MITLQDVELGVLGPLRVRQYGLPVAIPGAKPRAILTMLGLHGGAVVGADTLVEMLWGDDPPRTAPKALLTHISSLRRALGDGFVLTEGAGWMLGTAEIDAMRYKAAARLARDASAAGDASQAVTRFDEALELWRGTPELPDGPRGLSERTRWAEGHAALVEDRADALLATGRAAEIIGELEAAIADAPLRERRWCQLMLALYRAGRQGEALGAFQRARALLADELGVDPGPELRRLEAAIVAQDSALEVAVSPRVSSITRAVTFLLTDIEGSTAAWEADAAAMAVALARHDELVEQVVTSRGGRLVKTRGEGDATFSVFDRPSAAAAAAIELQEAIRHETWDLTEPIRVRVALHTGEVELRDGDYFGRAVNRAARLRSLAAGGQILCSGATAELVIDSLSDDVVLVDLGTRQLRNLARPEHVFELRLEAAGESRAHMPDAPLERPDLPAVLAGPGPFVGRGPELARLLSAWQATLDGGAHTVLIAGEPGVGKTRLAGEWCRHAHELGAVVLYGRCDEDLGAPYQPFAEALRALTPCLGADRLRAVRGTESLLTLVPGLHDVMPDLTSPARSDPDSERYALFDAVVALLEVASTQAPVVLVLDDLHWAAKPTLLLLRHLLRFGEQAHVLIVGTYRSTDLDRSHPLAAMLADLHRDGSATRLSLSGLDEQDVTAYVAEVGYDDEDLGRALASVTGGNPFFLIEALRHVDESGGRWDPSTLPQGVREAVSRRLSRLPVDTNKALAAAAVVGSRFAVDLVERVVGDDLVDAFDQAHQAGIVVEEPGGCYRFNHALVRQSLLAELASVRRMRLHQRIATTLEAEPGANDELLAELAHHYFECAWAGNAVKAVDYCRRAADQAMARLAYEGAADLYDHALHALDELDDELPDREDTRAELLIARCEALLAAGDVVTAAAAVAQLQEATGDSARLAAWGVCFDGQLSMLTHPSRLDEIEGAVSVAAGRLAEVGDAAGEAKAHTVRAGCLARLGRVGDCETALDHALTAARRAHEHRRVNAVLANAPLAALWGPNPVPRAGGRCLDVVRLLRITTGSPVVEATSTRCQAVLDAFRGRAPAARRLIESARRALTELGMRHALLEVDQFAGIVELIADEPAAAEQFLRRAYDGFRRMGIDADTADTAALLARACLALDRDAEADTLCVESERLAGHALKPSIAWRVVRAQLLSRSGAHDEARQVAEEAVAIAERTDALVDHGDACLALATVLSDAGDVNAARAAAERAAELYERKGAVALAEKARRLLGERAIPTNPLESQMPHTEPRNACVDAGDRVVAAVNGGDWDEVERLYAPRPSVESRRRLVGFTQADVPADDWARQNRQIFESGSVRLEQSVIAVRGSRLALVRLGVGSADVSPGAPHDEFLQVYGIDSEGRVALQVWFDVEDTDAALAELDAAHARLQKQGPRPGLENAASRLEDKCYRLFADGRPDEIAALLAEDHLNEDRRQGLGRVTIDRATAIGNIRAIAALDVNITATPLALRGDRLCLSRIVFEQREGGPDAFCAETLELTEIDSNGLMTAKLVFDPSDFEVAIGELDARYVSGEAESHRRTWSVIAGAFIAHNRKELPPTTPDPQSIDHRRTTAFGSGEGIAYLEAGWDMNQDLKLYIEQVHRLGDLGAVFTWAGNGSSREGFAAEWRGAELMTVDGDLLSRAELFDEADLDVAIARFERLQSPRPKLENAASQLSEHFLAHFAARDWDALADMFANGYHYDDRRRGVNSGVRHGRDHAIEDIRSAVDLGLWANLSSTVIATRGSRLALNRFRAAGHDPEAVQLEVLQLGETDADERFTRVVVFDADDIDAAFTELDTWYLAGEAATYADTWSVIADGYAALNRRQVPATSPNWVNFDHRRATPFAPGEQLAFIRAAWEDTPDIYIRVAEVYRLNDVGAVVLSTTHGTSKEGFDAEWREIEVLTVDGDRFSRCEVFGEADLDAALARFDELGRPVPRLHNAASQADARFWANFAVRDWDATAKMVADGVRTEDRRRIVNAGIRQGRDALIAECAALAELGAENAGADVIATRGERQTLSRVRLSVRDQAPEIILVEVLVVVELDTAGKVLARILFDADDIDAAFEELDARYLTGEAALCAHTWSLVAGAYAALNRRELPATTADYVSIDHRGVTPFAPGDVKAYTRSSWNQMPDLSFRIEAVHRLNTRGAVITHALQGTSREGFEAEWRDIHLLMVEGDRFNRSEFFNDSDLDAALVRFDELSRPSPALENKATRMHERLTTCLMAGEWDALAENMAHGFFAADRRRLVGAGSRHGRDAALADARAIVDLGFTQGNSTVIAIRGQRLGLMRARFWGRDGRPDEFDTEVLHLVEIDASDRIATFITFDVDDIDAALAELDARYAASEACDYAHTWSIISKTYAAFNRHELSPRAPDWADVDHRRGVASAPGDMLANVRQSWTVAPDIRTRIEAVHRLSDRGAVFTHVESGRTEEGFDAEWREVTILMVDGDELSRCEIFDEIDLDAALVRFAELDVAHANLSNFATRARARAADAFNRRSLDGLVQVQTADCRYEDRRRGLRNEGFADLSTLRALLSGAPASWRLAIEPIAVRGERLALSRGRFRDTDAVGDPVAVEVLTLTETTDTGLISHAVIFDLEGTEDGFAQLDARYAAGEASEHPHTWSLVTKLYADLNRHELQEPAPDWVSVNHRRVNAFASGEGISYVLAAWRVTPDISYRIEAVHRLSHLGAVLTQVSKGTSQEGFDAEWRTVNLLVFDGEKVARWEMFDESDMDSALQRFEELEQSESGPRNAATRALEHIAAHFVSQDWTAFSNLFSDEYFSDDRRRIVGAGVQHGRDANVVDMHTTTGLGITSATSTVMATRGERLALIRVHLSDGDDGSDDDFTDLICIVEVDDAGKIVTIATFDEDAFQIALSDLDARYLAGEAFAFSQTWSVIVGVCNAFNRRELPATTADWVSIDHRRGAAFAPGELGEYINSRWQVDQNLSNRIEAVHRLDERGAVVTHVASGTTSDGFDAEWRVVNLFMVDGDRISRAEFFDEADLDVALAAFDELNPSPPAVDNHATRVRAQVADAFNRRDMDVFLGFAAADGQFEDRRKGLRDQATGAGLVTMSRALFDVVPTDWLFETNPFASRGSHLALTRDTYRTTDEAPTITAEHLTLTEINDVGLVRATVLFDPDDIETALVELESRYVAGEAAAHADTWSAITSANAAFNRREMPPTTPDWVNVDHRRGGLAFAPGDQTAYIRASWDVASDISNRIVAVHRLNSLGAAFTQAVQATSSDGFDADWRDVVILTLVDDMIDRCEVFDEADLNAALARFDELSQDHRPDDRA